MNPKGDIINVTRHPRIYPRIYPSNGCAVAVAQESMWCVPQERRRCCLYSLLALHCTRVGHNMACTLLFASDRKPIS
jgi:uncharacterized membrane protein